MASPNLAEARGSSLNRQLEIAMAGSFPAIGPHSFDRKITMLLFQGHDEMRFDEVIS
jgi:hypothetical protein